MSTHTAPSAQSNLWLLVADGKQARFYACQHSAKIIPLPTSSRRILPAEEEGWTLEPIADGSMAAEKLADYELGHDKRGSIFGGSSSVRHTVEPHTDMHEEVKRRFVKAVAAKVIEFYLQNDFDKLVIAAPPKVLGELREFLEKDVPTEVMKEIPKDLTHCSEHELLEHIEYALSSIRAA